MAISIRNNNDIKGLQIDNETHVKITQFADDTTIILDGSKKSILKAIKVVNNFGSISGLHLNVDKSVFLNIGSLKNDNENTFLDEKYKFTKGRLDFLVL